MGKVSTDEPVQIFSRYRVHLQNVIRLEITYEDRVKLPLLLDITQAYRDRKKPGIVPSARNEPVFSAGDALVLHNSS